jgi:hypothetical protein
MEGLKSFFASHLPDDLTAKVLEKQILRLESKAEKIEYDNWNSQPHLDAAQLIRKDANALKTVLSRVHQGVDGHRSRQRVDSDPWHSGRRWTKLASAQVRFAEIFKACKILRATQSTRSLFLRSADRSRLALGCSTLPRRS